jgi:hypothetical protein
MGPLLTPPPWRDARCTAVRAEPPGRVALQGTCRHMDVPTKLTMDVPAKPVRSPAAAPGRAKSSGHTAGYLDPPLRSPPPNSDPAAAAAPDHPTHPSPQLTSSPNIPN